MTVDPEAVSRQPAAPGRRDTEVLERGTRPMKALKRLVGEGIAKGVNEKLCIEDVFAGGHHRSGSGEAISTPSMARVPSISSRWNTARSSARSIASVAVAAPSARFAAFNFESGSR